MIRTAVVSGAASGIGAATVDLLTRNNWSVIGVDYQEEDVSGVCSAWIKGDVALQSTWISVSKVLKSQSGNLDLLVNNAGVLLTQPIATTKSEDWDNLMAANVRSCFLAVRTLQDVLHGGAIVNIASVHAITTSLNMSAYAASKGAIVSLTRELAIELSSKQIRVNTVLPGAVDTPMLRKGLSREHFGTDTIQDQLELLASRTVSGRIGTASEISEAIMFLGDNSRSSFVTGAALVVDGGASIRLSTE